MGKDLSGEKVGRYIFLLPLVVGILFVLISFVEKSSLGSIATIISGTACLFLSSGFFYYGNLRKLPVPFINYTIFASIASVGSLLDIIAYWQIGNVLSLTIKVLALLFFSYCIFFGIKKNQKR